jgi:hypothetical protein
MAASSSKAKNILELDQIVSDYLVFRKCDEASRVLILRRDFFSEDTPHNRKKPLVTSKILSAFDNGDYAELLSLWETYIVQFSSQNLSASLAYEIKAAEFLCNLHCAVYPFRSEVFRGIGKLNILTFKVSETVHCSNLSFCEEIVS